MDEKGIEIDYQYVYESFPDMCLSLETKTGRIISCNQTLLDTLGYKKEELLQLSLYDLYHPSQVDKVKDNLDSILNNRVPKNTEFIIRTKNGETLDVSLKLTFVKGKNGEVLYSNAVWRDIGELKRVQKELQLEKDKVEAQNKIIVEKNREFTDAVNYAKSIQQGILPSAIEVEKVFSNSMIFYEPKATVSGDFYWLHETGDNVLFSVLDCTGHGVPGAMMSMVGFSLLNQMVVEKGMTCPEEILNRMKVGVIRGLRQGKEGSANSDGMDAALCVLNKKTKKMELASANSSVVIIRANNIGLEEEGGSVIDATINNDKLSLFEIKGERQPIGYYFGLGRVFKKRTFQLMEEDLVFLYSDGFQDQIGGPKNKKFLSKRFKQLLLKNAHLSLPEQKELLKNALNEWRKGGQEQTDDICIWGVKV